MTAKRHYNLLCPIARALDVVGDRWSLLILRDLHAGPARFQELQEGLGIATIVLPLRVMLEAVADRPELTVRLVIDDDVFTVASTADSVDVLYGETPLQVDLVVRTSYEAFLDVGEGLMPVAEFAATHVEIVEGSEHADAFFALMGAALQGSGREGENSSGKLKASGI